MKSPKLTVSKTNIHSQQWLTVVTMNIVPICVDGRFRIKELLGSGAYSTLCWCTMYSCETWAWASLIDSYADDQIAKYIECWIFSPIRHMRSNLSSVWMGHPLWSMNTKFLQISGVQMEFPILTGSVGRPTMTYWSWIFLVPHCTYFLANTNSSMYIV